MKKIQRLLLVSSLVMIVFLGPVSLISAQCPMCHITAESNLANGGSQGKGLNNGIFYMLALPYTIVGVFGLIIWKNSRRQEEDELEVLP